jgi:hypothetical protein
MNQWAITGITISLLLAAIVNNVTQALGPHRRRMANPDPCDGPVRIDLILAFAIVFLPESYWDFIMRWRDTDDAASFGRLTGFPTDIQVRISGVGAPLDCIAHEPTL